MKSEKELMEDKLAYIRDNLFDENDYGSDEGHNLVGAYAGSAYEVVCGVERKLKRQQQEIAELKEILNKRPTKTMTIMEHIREESQCNYADIIDYLSELNQCGDELKAKYLGELIWHIHKEEQKELIGNKSIE